MATGSHGQNLPLGSFGARGRWIPVPLATVGEAPLGGGGGTIKAERVCRLVLLGVRMCAPVEEGILHLWGGWLPTVGLGVKREGSEKAREVGSQMGHPTAEGQIFLQRESGSAVLLLTNAVSAPWRLSRAGADMLDTGAVCSGAFSHQGPAAGPRQCFAVGVRPIPGAQGGGGGTGDRPPPYGDVWAVTCGRGGGGLLTPSRQQAAHAGHKKRSSSRAGERPQAPFAHRAVENGRNEDQCARERGQQHRLSCNSTGQPPLRQHKGQKQLRRDTHTPAEADTHRGWRGMGHRCHGTSTERCRRRRWRQRAP